MSLNPRRLITSKAFTQGLVNGYFHLFFQREIKEEFPTAQDTLLSLFGDCMADQVEEAVCVNGIADLSDDPVLCFW